MACVAGMLIVLSLVQAAYAGPRFPDYPARKASDCAVKVEKAGLKIGIQPLVDLKEQKTYFNTELTAQGFLPVYIVLENGSSGDSFLFDKTGITYGPADTGLSTAPKADEKAEIGVAIYSTATLAAGGVPIAGMVVIGILSAKASQVSENILKKELQSRTLSPGESAYGFLYIPVPKNAPRQKTRLRIPITMSGTDEPIVLDLVF
jgi:hypothetical protein